MNGTFYEQLGGVAGLFDQWGACEKTVVACALARKVPWPGLKLLQQAVDAALRKYASDERGDAERDANDELLLASLLTEEQDDEGADHLKQLLALLPLLRTDNERAKDVYMTAAPALVQRYVDAPRISPASDLCRQLLTYLLVHPALTHHDQRTLTPWLRYLESHISGNNVSEPLWNKNPVDPCLLPNTSIWGTANAFRRTIGKNVEFRDVDPKHPEPINESFSKNGRDVDLSIDNVYEAATTQPKSHRSNSLTPPTTNFMQMSSSAENLSEESFVQKPRSFSLSSEHSLSQIRPMSILYGTTGSETRLDDLRCGTFVEYPGMSMVAQWLKSLRLHKYVWLFTNITYDQMMAMDEEYLEKLGVTKGARHKLLLSIQRLNDRKSILSGMEMELHKGASPAAIARVLERLRTILISPMAPSSEIPECIVRILEMASHKLISSGCSRLARQPQPEDGAEPAAVDPMSMHCWLVEKALHHESFHHPRLCEALKRMRHRLPPRQFFHHVSDMPLSRRVPKPRWRVVPPGHQPPPWLPGKPATGPPQPRDKSHSYPPYPPQAPPSPAPSDNSCDEYSSLDALCLQMTEQAIN